MGSMDATLDLKNCIERRRVRDRERERERELGLVAVGCSREHQRVKVYRLNEDGKWEDQGTGHVTVDYVERSEDLGLFVIDEEDNETLLLHRITPDDIYRKQEDTIISWRDPEYSTELALSFQETAGCSYIWDHICNVQRNMHFTTLNHDTFHSVNSELRELPAVELSTLPLILKIVVESGITDQMRLTELVLHDQEFFRKLMNLFRISEDLENLDSLHIIYKIVKGILMLNSPQIFEKVFGDEFIMDIIGCLEYDPDVPHVRHRDFLMGHVVFKEAIPIKDPTVLSKIHQTYRIGYLKDVALTRVLDDATIASLNSIVHANNGVVVSLLKEDNTFIQELFSRLKSPSTSVDSKKNLVYFLHEFCTLSKSLQMVQQLRLFRDLVNEGLFDIISDILQSEDKRLVLTGTDILILFLNQDPNLLRSYVVRPEGTPLLGLLVQGLLTDFGDNMHCQFLEILRTLLDSYTLSGAQRDTIIEIFYERHLGQLIDAITYSCPGGGKTLANSDVENLDKHSYTKPEILLSVCELLCFCVVHHLYKIKCNFLLNNSMDKVLYLTRRREKYLVVAAVRFVRTVISRNDENLNNYIMRRSLLKPIVDAFVANGDRYNLLNSAALELFEYIRKESVKPLLKYLVESFWSQLSKFDKLASIQSLRVKYEQSLESIGTKSAVNVDSRKRVEDRALEKEEEDYFNEDSDEEDTASATVSNNRRVQEHPVSSNGSAPSCATLSPKPGGLVDYDDDEDDEDYKPPPKRQTEASDGDEGILESLSMKRKVSSKEEPGLVKKQRLDQKKVSRESILASLCTTLSQAVLPNKKAARIAHNASQSSNTQSTVDMDNGQKREAEVVGNHNDENSLADKNGNEEIITSQNNVADEIGSKEIITCQNSSADKNGSEEIITSPNNSGTSSKSRENGQMEGEEHPHLPTNSSSEMVVNGS
ncbi:serine/threonine-protein phosphatase 4 regulatory subunit 3-like isoform X2 [Chenopodium quinoa]|uniref:serine/threonine-protein phosphatase 4 regulatory subunit 3-like isoform X2 n=1 Tax=Chenopodium quinoa TaxID=63459 RepID=UPI000B77D7A4|nr:serine/threonine-protein phosphatase 4 regulatory subunit 3-like isoform X2 [Chenopodium quinoa]